MAANDVYTLDEVFCLNSRASHHTVKRWYRSLSEYVCVDCGNTGEHNGKPLTLQLDHINGNRDDCRRENLRWLCPNCHSQTLTFSGSKNDSKRRQCDDRKVFLKGLDEPLIMGYQLGQCLSTV